jgi:RLL motif-containing protein 1
MLRNKLISLGHPNPEINTQDMKSFRNLIVWLEDQHIRNYKIEDRAELRKITSPEWSKAFEKYKEDLNYPKELTTEVEQLKWIVSYAIKLEYSDNRKASCCLLFEFSIYNVLHFQWINTVQ